MQTAVPTKSPVRFLSNLCLSGMRCMYDKTSVSMGTLCTSVYFAFVGDDGPNQFYRGVAPLIGR